MKKTRIYLASGWFTPKTRDILDNLETLLSRRDDVSLYSPRRDGIMLTPNQRHDTTVRESVFKDNISHILDSDLVVANIQSTDGYNDPGTVYEIGYAMSHGIPVLGFAEDSDNILDRFKGFMGGFDRVITEYQELQMYLDNYNTIVVNAPDKVLFVGAGVKEVDSKIATYIADSGMSLRWINDENNDIYESIDDIFENVKFMIAVVDDRRPLVSWMIGQAYSRGIPVVTYSDYGYGINVMLLVSILTHIRGTEELNQFLQQVKRAGLESIPKFDISQLDSM